MHNTVDTRAHEDNLGLLAAQAYRPTFLQRLAAHGYVPKSAEEEDRLLRMGDLAYDKFIRQAQEVQIKHAEESSSVIDQAFLRMCKEAGVPEIAACALPEQNALRIAEAQFFTPALIKAAAEVQHDRAVMFNKKYEG